MNAPLPITSVPPCITASSVVATLAWSSTRSPTTRRPLLSTRSRPTSFTYLPTESARRRLHFAHRMRLTNSRVRKGDICLMVSILLDRLSSRLTTPGVSNSTSTRSIRGTPNSTTIKVGRKYTTQCQCTGAGFPSTERNNPCQLQFCQAWEWPAIRHPPDNIFHACKFLQYCKNLHRHTHLANLLAFGLPVHGC